MINKEDFLKGAENAPKEHLNNIHETWLRVNAVLFHFLQDNPGAKVVVTSCYRDNNKHIGLYKAKAKATGIPFELIRVPMASNHLFGRAVDLGGKDIKLLQQWCLKNVNILEDQKLWCEDFNYTHNWAHFQTVPPKSKRRFFIP